MKTLKAYIPLILFIAGWWTCAFKKPVQTESFVQKQPRASLSPIILDTAITSIERPILQQALSGDSRLMARLIADWDIDAQILTAKGFDGIKRISQADFLQSQSLIRTLQNDEAAQKSAALLRRQIACVSDDSGNSIDLQCARKKFLPQTFAAASLLLSLVPPEQIVALPGNLRKQSGLYPRSVTDKIPLDIDRYNAEKLFQAQPEIAFIAHYSHPATVQALVNQGVSLYTMKNIQTLPDISEELLRVGTIADKPLQAELMKIFIEAAIIALDNRQAVLISRFEQRHASLPRVLVVNFHQSFSVPTAKTLTGQILSRMQSLDISLKYANSSGHVHEWMAPIDRERLINLDPDILIVATENEEAVAKELHRDSMLKEVSAMKHNHLLFVDGFIQHSPSQYVVLAYHDLIQALASIP